MVSNTPDSGAAARRAKKRELDRLAQRAARERTRSRIAHLEATVQAMAQKESDGRAATLVEQLAETTRQRDDLAKVVSSIEAVIRRHRGTERGTSDRSEELPQAVCLGDADLAPEIGSVEFPEDDFDLALTESLDALTSPEVPSLLPWTGAAEVIDNGAPLDHSPFVIIPEPEKICDCVAPPSMPPPGRSSIWRRANETLSGQEALPRHMLQYEDDCGEDIPIRAILEGWDNVERTQDLPPLWRRLRRIDQLQFSSCGKTERLAILRLMHRLLRYQVEPTTDQFSKLPPWFLSRPAQAIPHSSAIDFFVWPGVRERFVFAQHQYCSNSFWRVFADSFRILWPYEFRDCYKTSTETGLYSLSHEFETRINEIGSWTMAPDFFHRYPEMYADIPSFNTVPPACSTRYSLRRRPPGESGGTSELRRNAAEDCDGSHRSRKEYVAIIGGSSPEPDGHWPSEWALNSG